MSTLSPRDQARVGELAERWWHSIELPDGSVTRGYKTREQLATEWATMQVPDLTGKSVLDIGAWDGYFSFRAEAEGAQKVTAIDHFVWSIDPIEKMAYEQRCREAGERVRPYDEVPELWHPDDLPGKRSFDLAKELLKSKVEAVVLDFMACDADELPSADIVFFLGVLYHLKDPVGALERLRRVTQEMVIIETEAIFLPNYPSLALAEFVPGEGLYGDPTNWWAPTMSALIGLATAAGFSRVDPVGPGLEQARGSHGEYLRWATSRAGPKPFRKRPNDSPDLVYRYRATVHAWA